MLYEGNLTIMLRGLILSLQAQHACPTPVGVSPHCESGACVF